MKRFYCLASFIYPSWNNNIGWVDKDYIIIAENQKEASKKVWSHERKLGAVRRCIYFTDYKTYVRQKHGRGKILK